MEVKVDPLKDYTKVNPLRLIEACGIIPQFVNYAADTGAEDAQAFMDLMSEAYGFGLSGNMLDHGGAVSPEGKYTYPEDAPLYPLVEWRTPEGITVWVYEYAIVAVRDSKDNTVMTRMD